MVRNKTFGIGIFLCENAMERILPMVMPGSRAVPSLFAGLHELSDTYVVSESRNEWGSIMFCFWLVHWENPRFLVCPRSVKIVEFDRYRSPTIQLAALSGPRLLLLLVVPLSMSESLLSNGSKASENGSRTGVRLK